MGKVAYSMEELRTKLYRDTAGDRTVLGNVYLTSTSDRQGGLDIIRSYQFQHYYADESCHLDREDVSEFERDGMRDAIEWLEKQFLNPNMILETTDPSRDKAGITIKRKYSRKK